ncbi:hypothetical protein CANARDRAFT_28476 [[Candida] arabinofermentans NRRL YB-2248]|uniref:PH domain-containing protein n=1 Tax=[Candida] arabinofermentans NRRL YB-2248 TaxID=983967 RepID=A0A1E4T0A4_9ASCO|nr:hypothetical protein CANARDRAFT_28476 [[Candida] arabinofermentans NRRL YB-2248]
MSRILKEEQGNLEGTSLLESSSEQPSPFSTPTKLHIDLEKTENEENYMSDEGTSLLPKEQKVLREDEVFKIANQSVDDLLNEIEIHSKSLGISADAHSSSPLTAPLKVQNREMTDQGEDSTDNEVDESGFVDTSLQRSDSVSIHRARQTMRGPRTYEASPTKILKKQVNIDMSPPKVVEYEVLSDVEYSDESIELNEAEKLDVNWDTVPSRISDNSLIGRPLPKITPSDSNYSIKSMPNLSTGGFDLFTSPTKEPTRDHNTASDDSEETIALSPVSQAKYPKVEQNSVIENKSPESKTTFSISSPVKLTYDHESYLEDMRRGELIESKEIVDNKAARKAFKDDLTYTKNDKSPTESEEIIESLGELYETNIRNTDGTTLNLKRNDSVRSVMSINSAERKLNTVLVNKQVNNLELRDGVQGFTDKQLDEILETGVDSEGINPGTDFDKNSADVDLDEEDESVDKNDSTELVSEVLPKANRQHNHQHNHQRTRSTSLTLAVGSFLKTVKRSISGQAINQEIGADELQVNLNDMPRQSSNKRQFSSQSNATSMNNDSDFVSAEEGDSISDESSSISRFDDSAGTIELHDTAIAGNDTILSEKQDSANGEKMKGFSENEVIASSTDKHGESSLANTTTENVSDVSNASFASEKFVLELSAFDDDPYAFSAESADDPNLSTNTTTSNVSSTTKKRVVSSESSPKSELLAIWSTQEDFKNPLHKPSNSFQSICDPTSKFIIKESHHKSISVISHRSTTSSFSASKYSPRISSPRDGKFAFSRDSSVKRKIPNKKISAPKDISTASVPHIAEVTFNNPMNESTIDDTQVSASTSKNNKNTSMTPSVAAGSSEVHETATSSAYLNNSVAQNDSQNNVSQSQINDSSIHLSDVLGDDDIDDSFLDDLENWEMELDSKDEALPSARGIVTNKETLSNVWRRGTLSKKRVHSKIENESIKFPQLSVDEMEKFMIHKRMASDDFQIKNANNQFVLEDNSHHKEQQGLMVNVNTNVDRDVASTNDQASTLVPDLAIPVGLAISSTDETFNARVPVITVADENKVDLEAVNDENSHPNVPTSPSRYGILVPQTRRDVHRSTVVTSSKDETGISKVQPLGESSSSRINSISNINSESQVQLKSIALKPEEKVESPQTTSANLVNGEQGRLFLRMIGLKELALPDITSRSAKFQIVLDNGIHCLTTDYFNIDNASFIPINKEFELIVADQLDIVITLKLRYNKPKDRLVEVVEKRKVKSKNIVARCFGAKDILTTVKYVSKPADFDPLSTLVANDGSFGKFHFNFDDFKSSITGRSRIITLQGFNEWKSYKDISSGKYVNAEPYRVCAIDFNLLFIPRTSEYEVLPISIKNSIEQINEIRKTMDVSYEGHLYQEGGDVEVWTRRFYKLRGYDLTAHNETTKKMKAKINLKKVVEIIYAGKPDVNEDENELKEHLTDIKLLTAPKIGEKAKPRVFSETLILNDGFKLRFSNGETVDFGCDSKEEKLKWISIIEDIVLKNNFRKQPWVKLMLQSNENQFPTSMC